jgi:hypothetical protein
MSQTFKKSLSVSGVKEVSSGGRKMKKVKCKKWTKISSEKADYYDRSDIIRCAKCTLRSKYLYFVQNEEYGDYYCPCSNPECEMMGNTRYMCLMCGKKLPEITSLEEDESE